MDKRLIGLTAAGLLAAGAAHAQATSPEGPGQVLSPQMFEAIDVNGDGHLSQTELQTHAIVIVALVENFGQADQNADGILDEAEFAAIEVLPEGHPGLDEIPGKTPESEPGATPAPEPGADTGVM